MYGRQIVIDTETTGLIPEEGHRIIEIGGVELLNRRFTGNNFHVYLNPNRAIDSGALAVHGLSDEFLADKPSFSEIWDELLKYIVGAELIIHNASFDIGFLNQEMKICGRGAEKFTDYANVIDTLAMARKKHPGQRNSLDALCRRYNVDNSKRDLHGALLDAQLLAQVYLAMTGGQFNLFQGGDEEAGSKDIKANPEKELKNILIHSSHVVHATAEEEAAHREYLRMIESKSNNKCLWDLGEKVENEE